MNRIKSTLAVLKRFDHVFVLPSEIKKKYRPGRIEEDPTDPQAIVVNYDVEEYAKSAGDEHLALSYGCIGQ